LTSLSTFEKYYPSYQWLSTIKIVLYILDIIALKVLFSVVLITVTDISLAYDYGTENDWSIGSFYEARRYFKKKKGYTRSFSAGVPRREWAKT
jgi:hypothetical protein